MDNLQKYKPTDKMIDLISDLFMTQVMSRFGLSLRFGDKTVQQFVSNRSRCRTFLIVVNFYV